MDVATNPADIADFATLYHRWRTARALLFRVARRNGACKLFRPQDSKGKTRNLLCICPFPASVYIFSLYSDDETQDVVGRLCAHDLECFGYSFHK